jgi:hypothetical protein
VFRQLTQVKEHRRIYYKKTPIIVFAPNGDPVAVYTDGPLVVEATVARRSLDSLLQPDDSGR